MARKDSFTPAGQIALDSCSVGRIRQNQENAQSVVYYSSSQIFSHILLNQTQNNPITSVSSPEFAEMFNEYVKCLNVLF